MKKLYLLLLILFSNLLFNSSLYSQCYGCEYLRIQDPQKTWYSAESSISEASIIIKPVGMYYQYDVYLTYSSYNPYYTSIHDTFEVQHFFKLPENALIVDSWLWVEDTIMKAQILDRSTAFNIYEGIVNRRKDPSILFKNSSTHYEFRIFPIPYGKTRKVKLTILIPASLIDNKIECQLPLSILKDSKVLPNTSLTIYEKDTNNKPYVSLNNIFTEGVHPTLGKYKSTTLTQSQLKNNTSISFGMEQEVSNEISVFYSPDTASINEGNYQIYLNTTKLYNKFNNVQKEVVYVIDHNSSYAISSKDELKLKIKNHMASVLNPDDKVRIYYNRLTTKEATNGWQKFSDINLTSLFNSIDIGNTSILSPTLAKVYEDIKDDDDAIVYLFSSDVSLTTSAGSQQLKEDLIAEFGTLNRTYILDYIDINKYGGYIYHNDVFYYGNNLFYKILSSNTKGDTENVVYNNDFDTALSNLKKSEFESTFENFEFYLKLQNGICFDNYKINHNGGILQVGKYKGDIPFNVEYYFINNNELFTETLEVLPNLINRPVEAKHIHAGLKILNLENSSNISDREKTISLSLENRVLSLHTAFLALEPSMQQPCIDCQDEDDVVIDVEDVKELELKISARPNPFYSDLEIVLKNTTNEDVISNVELYSLNGNKFNLQYDVVKHNDEIIIRFTNIDLPSGIYFVRLIYEGKVYNIKVVKL